MRQGCGLGRCSGLSGMTSTFVVGRCGSSARSTTRTQEDGTPKSGHARTVDMGDDLADVLKRLKVRRAEQALKYGWGEVPAWVFDDCGPVRQVAPTGPPGGQSAAGAGKW